MKVAGVLARGGTSKCWLFYRGDLPSDVQAVEEFLLSTMGSGDPRQINGVGGGTPTTSKCAVVARSTCPGVDVSYAFAQVGVEQRTVEWHSNCGNCSTAIALYAVDRGLVPLTDPVTQVVMQHEASGDVISARVDTPGARLPTVGTATVPGVVGSGVGVDIRFNVIAPSAPDITSVSVPHPRPGGPATVRIGLSTAGAPIGVVPAADLGATAGEDIAMLADLIPVLASLRPAVARALDLRVDPADAAQSVPKIGIVGRPVDYLTSTGRRMGAESYDLAIRMLSMTSVHPTIGITSAIGLAVMSLRPQSVVGQLLSDDRQDASILRFGTPGGIVGVGIETIGGETTSAEPRKIVISVQRSARILGYAEVIG